MTTTTTITATTIATTTATVIPTNEPDGLGVFSPTNNIKLHSLEVISECELNVINSTYATMPHKSW